MITGTAYRSADRRTYSWVMEADDALVGTIGAYDYQDGRIEVGDRVYDRLTYMYKAVPAPAVQDNTDQ